MATGKSIIVKETSISIIQVNKQDYIFLTDTVRSLGDESIMYNWLRNRNTIEFLGLWEQINNNNFKPIEFDRFKMESGSGSIFHNI